jgi:hypothetical protein
MLIRSENPRAPALCNSCRIVYEKKNQWSVKLPGKQKFYSDEKQGQWVDMTSDNSGAQKEVAKCRTRDVQPNRNNASMS